MSKENALKALVATKQVEIDKLKRRIKELEYINDSLHRIAENERIEQGGWNSDGNNTRQRSTKTRKASKRTSKSSHSNK